MKKISKTQQRNSNQREQFQFLRSITCIIYLSMNKCYRNPKKKIKKINFTIALKALLQQSDVSASCLQHRASCVCVLIFGRFDQSSSLSSILYQSNHSFCVLPSCIVRTSKNLTGWFRHYAFQKTSIFPHCIL